MKTIDFSDNFVLYKTKRQWFGASAVSNHNVIFREIDAMTEPILTKICSKCQEAKSISEFYKNPKGKYHCWCRPCCAEYARNIRKINPVKTNENARKYYYSKRDEINAKQAQRRKENLEYYRKKSREYAKKRRTKNIEYAKQYRENNKEILRQKRKIKYEENIGVFRIRQKIQYQKNKDALKNRQREYNKTHKKEIAERDKLYRKTNAKAIAERQKEYRNNNLEKLYEYQKKFRENNRKRLSEYQKEYRKTEKGKDTVKKGSLKHKALKLEAKIEDFSPLEIFERDNYICQLCGCKTRPEYKNPNHLKYPNLDHIIPLSKGGDHSRANTQCLCHQCNMKKSNTGIGDQLRLFG